MHTSRMFDLSGRVAIITGGYKGLGYVFAEALTEMGASIVVCGRNIDDSREEMQGLNLPETRVLAVRCDVTNPADVQCLVDETIKKFGRVDILINNAGISYQSPPENYPLKEWQRVIDINLTGTFLCSQAAGRKMIEQKEGNIINVSSMAGVRGDRPEHLNAIAYNTTKGGVHAFTRDLACKWAKHNIRVNAIAPGIFAVGMARNILGDKEDLYLSLIPLRRFGGSDDLKGAVVFLASAASSYITGQVLLVDGGATAW